MKTAAKVVLESNYYFLYFLFDILLASLFFLLF